MPLGFYCPGSTRSSSFLPGDSYHAYKYLEYKDGSGERISQSRNRLKDYQDKCTSWVCVSRRKAQMWGLTWASKIFLNLALRVSDMLRKLFGEGQLEKGYVLLLGKPCLLPFLLESLASGSTSSPWAAFNPWVMSKQSLLHFNSLKMYVVSKVLWFIMRKGAPSVPYLPVRSLWRHS